MEFMKLLLLTLGVMLALILLSAAAIFMERKFPSENYDERQKQARGRAYCLSFWVGIIYYFIIMCIMIFGEIASVEPYLLLFFGFTLQVMVLHIYCVMTHAAVPLSEKPGVAIISYFVMGVLNLLMNDYSKPFPLVGERSVSSIRPVLGIIALALASMHLIQLMRDRKE